MNEETGATPPSEEERPEQTPSDAPAPPEEGPGPPSNPETDEAAAEQGVEQLDKISGN